MIELSNSLTLNY